MTALLLLFFLITPSEGQTEPGIPGLKELSVDSESLEHLLEDRQFVLLHDTAPAVIRGETQSVRYVTGGVIVDTKPRYVRRTLTSFSKYPDYFPAYTEANILESDKPGTAVQFDLSLNMAIIEPAVRYTLRFTDEPDGSLVFQHIGGGFMARRGRWELFDAGNDGTLLVLTSWIDYTGLGWSTDAVLWAQPELQRALPVTRNATLVDTLRRQSEFDSPVTEKKTLNTPNNRPSIPRVLADTDRHEPLRQLTRKGIPMLIHPDQPIRSNGETISLIFTSTVDLVKGPANRARKHLTNFEKVPDFVRQLETVNSTRTDTGFVADWTFDLGFGLVSIPVSYRVVYEWTGSGELVFRRIRGDFRHIYGAYEWASLSPNRTLYAFTSASHIGENAPSLVQLGDLIPNRQIFMGVTLGAIGVENGVKWTNRRIRSGTTHDPAVNPGSNSP